MSGRKTNSNPQMAALLYAVFLILSLLIIVISITVFIVIIYIQGDVSTDLYLLLAGILAVNIFISSFSLRGLSRLYFTMFRGNRILLPGKKDDDSKRISKPVEVNERYFSKLEIMIMDILKENGGRILQSKLVEMTSSSKASVSRAITSLENKGLLIRVRKGVTNEIIWISEE